MYDNLTKSIHNNNKFSFPEDNSTFYQDTSFVVSLIPLWEYLQGTIYYTGSLELNKSEIYYGTLNSNPDSTGAVQALCTAIWFPGEIPAFDKISTIGNNNIATSLTNG